MSDHLALWMQIRADIDVLGREQIIQGRLLAIGEGANTIEARPIVSPWVDILAARTPPLGWPAAADGLSARQRDGVGGGSSERSEMAVFEVDVSGGARARIQVLLAENRSEDAERIEVALATGGFDPEVTVARSAARFEEAVGERCFDVILSDYDQEEFPNLSALSHARRHCPEIPFVFVTRAVGEDRLVELLHLGATDYVLKDRLDRLAPSVERAIREARAKADRAAAERALAESERSLTRLMANMPGMAFRCVPEPPWVFEYASPGVSELCGYAPEDFYAGGSITWAELMHADDVERVAALADAAIAARKQLTVSYRIRTRTGEEKWVWDRSVGVYDDAGRLLRLEGFATDITEQKRQEAEAAQRIAFEEQLIGIVSHDLRNPLNVVSLACETLQRLDSQDPRIAKGLARIKSATDRSVRLINDVLDYTQARMGGGLRVERSRVALRDVVAQVVDEVESTHPSRPIHVEHAGVTEGDWDRDRLTQVLGNLISNALRYGAPGSAITIRTEADSSMASLHVHNVGPAIPADLLPNLFQPMQRGTAATDKTSRSVGLGLYIVDHIVRLHGGTVGVESSERGTTFSVHLPVDPPSSGRSPSSSS